MSWGRVMVKDCLLDELSGKKARNIFRENRIKDVIDVVLAVNFLPLVPQTAASSFRESKRQPRT